MWPASPTGGGPRARGGHRRRGAANTRPSPSRLHLASQETRQIRRETTNGSLPLQSVDLSSELPSGACTLETPVETPGELVDDQVAVSNDGNESEGKLGGFGLAGWAYGKDREAGTVARTTPSVTPGPLPL